MYFWIIALSLHHFPFYENSDSEEIPFMYGIVFWSKNVPSSFLQEMKKRRSEGFYRVFGCSSYSHWKSLL